MAKFSDDGQQKILRVVEQYQQTDVETAIDPKTGQVRLFSKQPQVEMMLNFFNTKLGNVQDENKQLRQEVHETNKQMHETNKQMARVGNSLSRLVSKFDEMIVTNESPELMVSPHEPGREDVTLVDSPLPTEAAYRLTTSDLASYVGMHASRMGTLLTHAKIKGNRKYHCALKSGAKSTLNLYKPRALKGLYDYVVENKATWIKTAELEAIQHYLIAHELL